MLILLNYIYFNNNNNYLYIIRLNNIKFYCYSNYKIDFSFKSIIYII